MLPHLVVGILVDAGLQQQTHTVKAAFLGGKHERSASVLRVFVWRTFFQHDKGHRRMVNQIPKNAVDIQWKRLF